MWLTRFGFLIECHIVAAWLCIRWNLSSYGVASDGLIGIAVARCQQPTLGRYKPELPDNSLNKGLPCAVERLIAVDRALGIVRLDRQCEAGVRFTSGGNRLQLVATVRRAQITAPRPARKELDICEIFVIFSQV